MAIALPPHLPIRPGYERIVARIIENLREDAATGCWVWQLYCNPKGYGRQADGQPVTGLVHRRLYIALVRDLGDDEMLDHLCRNPPCANPLHLEVVTPQENTLRGISAAAQRARQTHCSRGHEYTPENTYRHPTRGTRDCRACNAIRQRKTQATKRAAESSGRLEFAGAGSGAGRTRARGRSLAGR